MSFSFCCCQTSLTELLKIFRLCLLKCFLQIWSLGCEPACWAAPEPQGVARFSGLPGWSLTPSKVRMQKLHTWRKAGRGSQERQRAGAGSSSQQPETQLETALQVLCSRKITALEPGVPGVRCGSPQGGADMPVAQEQLQLHCWCPAQRVPGADSKETLPKRQAVRTKEI